MRRNDKKRFLTEPVRLGMVERARSGQVGGGVGESVQESCARGQDPVPGDEHARTSIDAVTEESS